MTNELRMTDLRRFVLPVVVGPLLPCVVCTVGHFRPLHAPVGAYSCPQREDGYGGDAPKDPNKIPRAL